MRSWHFRWPRSNFSMYWCCCSWSWYTLCTKCSSLLITIQCRSLYSQMWSYCKNRKRGSSACSLISWRRKNFQDFKEGGYWKFWGDPLTLSNKLRTAFQTWAFGWGSPKNWISPSSVRQREEICKLASQSSKGCRSRHWWQSQGSNRRDPRCQLSSHR
jgi:hypothetical protein